MSIEPQDVIDIISAQRNDALNLVVVTKAELAAANRRIASLQKEAAARVEGKKKK